MNSAAQISGWLKAAKACLPKPIGELRGEFTHVALEHAQAHAQAIVRIWRLRRGQTSWLQLSR